MRIFFFLLIISTNLYCQKITLLDYNKKPIENANVRVNNNNYISSKQGQVKISKNLNKSKLIISHLRLNRHHKKLKKHSFDHYLLLTN